MKNYIKKLDKNFVINFVRETFGDIKEKGLISLRAEQNCYKVSFCLGNDKYGILFTNFCAICDNDKMSKPLTEKWRKELTKLFGNEYVNNLKAAVSDSLIK